MKKLSLILLVVLCCCKKSTTVNNPQNYVHFTFQQIWDSLGFVYEQKYWIPYNNDTLIFHSDNSITEVGYDIFRMKFDTANFNVHVIGVDTEILTNMYPKAQYTRQIYLWYIRIGDTSIAGCAAENLLFNYDTCVSYKNDSVVIFGGLSGGSFVFITK